MLGNLNRRKCFCVSSSWSRMRKRRRGAANARCPMRDDRSRQVQLRRFARNLGALCTHYRQPATYPSQPTTDPRERVTAIRATSAHRKALFSSTEGTAQAGRVAKREALQCSSPDDRQAPWPPLVLPVPRPAPLTKPAARRVPSACAHRRASNKSALAPVTIIADSE